MSSTETVSEALPSRVHPATSNAIHPSGPPHTRSLDESNSMVVFRPVDVEELFAQTTELVPWVVKGFLAKGILTLLAGPPKVGKTTLAYELIEAVALGRLLLGQEISDTKVLVLGLEEHKRDIIARLRTTSEEALKGRVKVVFGPLPFSEAVHKEMAAYIDYEEIGLVVVDTIHAWWGLTDENDASEVLRKGMPLINTIRQTNAAWLGLVHTRKSGGGHGQEIRGSSALVGLVDIALSMKRTESGGNQRLLEAVSRYVDTPDKLVIGYTEKGYRVLGTPDSVSAEAKAEKVRNALNDVGKTMDELSNETELSKQDVSRAISLLGHKVRREGDGQKGSPYRYTRNAIHP